MAFSLVERIGRGCNRFRTAAANGAESVRTGGVAELVTSVIADVRDLDRLELTDVFVLPEATENSDPSWFGFLLTVRNGIGLSRDRIVNHLESKGIQTRMLFAGNLIKHPCFDEMRSSGKGYRVAGSLANTDRIMVDSFWIGVYPGMTEEMIGYMCDTIRGCCTN